MIRARRSQRHADVVIFWGSPFTTAGFARMRERAGEAAGIGLKVHPHMLRHACGFNAIPDPFHNGH